jgi:class 3 adenylate cyclase
MSLVIGYFHGGSSVKGERVERRLAAILAADVVGYSRLMGQDEPGTLARLKAHRRELIDPEIAERKGRVVTATPCRAGRGVASSGIAGIGRAR